MAEYIEREKAKRLLHIEYAYAAEQLLDEIPAVDAEVVVRCKNCRSYNKPKTGWCEVHLDREHPDDFCSYGERKEVK